jgi:DNA-binding beta-propeller fold protein YncE
LIHFVDIHAVAARAGRCLPFVVTVLGLALANCGYADPTMPLVLQAKIALGDVAGRMDHFTIDHAAQRLFLAELGNNTVAVIDLKTRRLDHNLTGFSEPQGVAYFEPTSTLYVANGGDGSVQLFQGTDLAAAGQITLGADADNIHVDPARNHILVGYGNGGMAVINPATRAVIADIPLAAHPEGFQIDPPSDRAFVNLPGAGLISVIDLATGTIVADWPYDGAQANFPMAVDPVTQHILVAYRSPPKLIVFDQTGTIVETLNVCADADDIFVDPRRARTYISCGEGVIDVFAQTAAGHQLLAQVPTVPGARTMFLDPTLDLLFLAVRASGDDPASVWVFSPQP